MFQAREFARISGVTVRTLHHYDRLGLLKPKRRTPAGYRLYEARDLERLEQIVALKYLGLPLRQIRTLLDRSVSIASALRLQRKLLEEKRALLDRAIRAIGEAEQQLPSEGGENLALLKHIIEVIEMEEKQDWMTKYITEQARPKIESRKQAWSPELQERVSREWNELIADVKGSLDADPASDTARNLAARWNALVAEFTNRDPDIEQSVGNMWADRQNWPAEVSQNAPVIKPEIWQFIARANAGLRDSGK